MSESRPLLYGPRAGSRTLPPDEVETQSKTVRLSSEAFTAMQLAIALAGLAAVGFMVGLIVVIQQRDAVGERVARIADNSLPDEEWDYIIVGAGTAGSLVAKELSDDGLKRVLVLEEGPNRDTDPRILNQDGNRFATPAAPFPVDNVASGPARTLEFQTSGVHTYYKAWYTIPMAGTAVAGQANRNFLYGRGRVAGGTSALNAGFYVRPTNYTLDKIADATGDDEFRMINMLPRFKRIERFHANSEGPTNSPHYGYNGPIHVFFQNTTTGMGKVAAAANALWGLPITSDGNDPSIPYSIALNTQVNQEADTTRSFASRAFLVPSGPNQTVVRDTVHEIDDFYGTRKLRVLYKSTVIGFDWDPATIGTTELAVQQVRYLRNGFASRARLAYRGKLVLCAGLDSPALLLQNGIGPAAELTAAGVRVLSDSPAVGKMIENHHQLQVSINRNTTDVFKPNNNALATGGIFMPFGLDNVYSGEPTNLTLGRKFFMNVLVSPPGGTTFNIAIVPYDPPGRGFMTLISNDTLAPIRVDLDYLDTTDPTDIAQYRHGIRMIRDLVAQMALTDASYSMNTPSLTTIASDTLLNTFIRSNLAQNHHYLGSGRLGRGKLVGQNGETKGSVADKHGNVWDTANVEIWDATTYPDQIDCNIGGPLYAYILKQIDDLKSCRNPKSNWVGCA